MTTITAQDCYDLGKIGGAIDMLEELVGYMNACGTSLTAIDVARWTKEKVKRLRAENNGHLDKVREMMLAELVASNP